MSGEEEKAIRIHKESLIIDTLSPTFFLRPLGYTEKMRTRMKEMLDKGEPLSEIRSEMTEIFNEQLYEGETDYWRWWEESGVDVVHTTLGEVEGVTPPLAYESAIDQIAGWTKRFDAFDQLIKVTNSKDIQEARAAGKYGVILGFQNSHHIMRDLGKLELFYNLGIRIMQLTYNLRNNIGDGCTERTDAGLSEFGVRVVKKMNELGMLIDLSHSGYQTTMDAIELSDDPVIFTHTFCRSVYDHDRGKGDDEIKALAENNGYMGILLLPDFIAAKEASLDDFLDHLEHAIDILGIQGVGIGTDSGADAELLDRLGRENRWKEIEEKGITERGWRAQHFNKVLTEVRGFKEWRDFPNITKALISRGFNEGEIKRILGENFLRIFEEVVG